jgi:ATP-dependent Lhr-like helicase
LIAYLRRGNPNLQLFLPDEEPARTQSAKALAEFFVDRAHTEGGMLLTALNGIPIAEHPTARIWLEAGFVAAPMGFNVRRILPALPNAAIDKR